MKRAIVIFIRAIFGVHSPSLGRRIRVSDIWKAPYYEAVCLPRQHKTRR